MAKEQSSFGTWQRDKVALEHGKGTKQLWNMAKGQSSFGTWLRDKAALEHG